MSTEFKTNNGNFSDYLALMGLLEANMPLIGEDLRELLLDVATSNDPATLSFLGNVLRRFSEIPAENRELVLDMAHKKWGKDEVETDDTGFDNVKSISQAV